MSMPKFKKIDARKKYSEMEKEIVKFWKDDDTFKKSVEQRSKDRYFSFYDGPPFITGVPHHGTLLSSIVKDAVPRYWTMKGYRVERRWGWDCHGLPAEHMVEKKLGIKSKKEIEETVGVDKFIQTCFDETCTIADSWETMIDRIGRWVEFKNAYKTMDKDYMESVWWAFKQLYDKGLIYEDARVSLYCPRCSTPLSNFEIAMDNSYQMDKDPSVYVKMKLKGEEDTYFLVWTTTPWTLPANVALAVSSKENYFKLKVHKVHANETGCELREGETYIIEWNRLMSLIELNLASKQEGQDYFKVDRERRIVDGRIDLEIGYEQISGNDLIGLEYEPIFPHEIEGGYRVIAADFVTTESGTGIVHIAPAFGEDDFKARQQHGLPIINNVDEEGRYTDGIWKGEQVWDINTKVVGWLRDNGFLFKKENITHSYPHCHRCLTKLIYKAQSAWYLNVAKIRQELIDKNEAINWHPEHLKEGRFKKGLEGAPDWNISRDRYWGTAMPIWKCDNKECKEEKVFGSYDELKNASGTELEDYHLPKVDEITFKCEKCGGVMHRIPQVFDCWVESGSMPFAQFHYPFENKEQFEKSFPTDFISEYIAQTRAWFYVMHVLAVGIFGKEAFKNVVTTGVIAGSDGRKMSKSLGNYTDPNEVLEKYSADALRFYFLSSPLMNAEGLNFSEEAIKDIQRGLLGTLWNSYTFFMLYASVDNWEPKKDSKESKNLLDKWILSELEMTIKTVDQQMRSYEINKAVRPFEQFVDNLSNWYIRRSRRRFWKSESDEDKNNAYQTLWTVLVELSKAIAPFCPFIAEEMYRNLTGEESVHLADYPVAKEELIDDQVMIDMANTRLIIELGLSLRAENKIKVRQPLASLTINSQMADGYLELIKDEVNVKEVLFADKLLESDSLKIKGEGKIEVGLNVEMTPELKIEGQMRELVRQIQQGRKESGLEVEDRIIFYQQGADEIVGKFEDLIKKEILANEIKSGDIPGGIFQKKVKVEDREVLIGIQKM